MNDEGLFPKNQNELHIRIPLRGGKLYVVREDGVRKLCKQYAMQPHNAIGELRKLAAWNEANPKKRKTERGIRRHIHSWFSKVQINNAPVDYRTSGGFFK